MKQTILWTAVAILTVCTITTGCGRNGHADQGKITAEMAYQGVSNYCHSAYDWSVAEDNPDIMGVEIGEETDSAYLHTHDKREPRFTTKFPHNLNNF